MLDKNKYTNTTIHSSKICTPASADVSHYFKIGQKGSSRDIIQATVPRKIKVNSHNKPDVSFKVTRKEYSKQERQHNFPRALLSFNNERKKDDEKVGIFTKIARQRLKGEDPYRDHQNMRHGECVDESLSEEKNTEISWRDFQQELKNKRIFTGAGLRQFVPEVVEQFNVNFIEEVCCDDDSLMLDDSSINSFDREDFTDVELGDEWCNRSALSQEGFSTRCLNGDGIYSTSRTRLIEFLEEIESEEEASAGGKCEQVNHLHFVFIGSLVLLLSYSSLNM
mmetsp:Transcript_5176/g.7495  ORF Transcript_5176/g.7495 Transcript_5176/m.7495 type:complete len:280 (+) Transcript_5176:26-865(+)